MRIRLPAAILLFVWSFLTTSSGGQARPAARADAGGVLQRLTIANFGGSGVNSIQAVATDANGDMFVAGTTSSRDFPVKNAFQPAFADAGVLRTTDLGNTWSRVPAPLDVSSIYPDPVTSQILFGGGSAGIYKSSDGGQTWQVVYPLQSGISLRSLAIDAGNHLRIAALISPFASSGYSLVRSLDGGATWSTTNPPSAYGGQLIADPTGSGALATVGIGILLSRDWGLTFNPIYPSGAIGFPSTVAFDPSHPGWIYLDVTAGASGTLWLSTDFGSTWVARASPGPGFTNILQLAVDPDLPMTLVSATPDGLYLSTDGAGSWKRTAGPGGPFNVEGHYPFALVNHRCNSGGGLFAIGSGSGFIGTFAVAFTPDDGVTWRTPQLTYVTGVAADASCAVYVTRSAAMNGSDAFVAKLSASGQVLWATFLGGLDHDAPAGLAVDSQGNAYVAGTTYSPDFPSTVARIGVPGSSSVFVTKFWPDGTIAYSVLIGGEAANTATGIAVDSGQNAYVIGRTNSTRFPVTPGALVSQVSALSYTGFLGKLSPVGAEASGTYLGELNTYASSIILGADGTLILAGEGEPPGLPPQQSGPAPFLMKLDQSASRALMETYLPGISAAVASDHNGNLFVAGGLPATPGAYVSPASSSGCSSPYPDPSHFSLNTVSISKLDPNWQPIYTAQLRAPCGFGVGAMAVDDVGSVAVPLATGAGLPLHNPLLAGPTCSDNSSVIAKLSPDGSTLEAATYLDDCGVPAVAFANDGSVYAGVARQGVAGVLHFLRPTPGYVRAISLDWISNAFSGDSHAVATGALYTITGTGFQPPAVDLGLNPSQNLPTELGGVQVKFGGIPAAIMKTAPGRVTVVAPEKLALPADTQPRETKLDQRITTVQLIYNGVPSSQVLMPVAASLPGLLTLDYPNPQPGLLPDANARNQDGTLNDLNHPAAAGSTIALFATGLGATKPPVLPGSIASSISIAPVANLWATWQRNPSPGPAPPAEPVYSVPGFLSAMFQIQVQVPNPAPGGTQVGNGVQRVPIGFFLNPPPPSPVAPAASNLVNVYVK